MQNENEAAEPTTGSSVEEETSVTPSPLAEVVADEAPVSTPEHERVEASDAAADVPVATAEVEVVIDLEETDIPAESFDDAPVHNLNVHYDDDNGRDGYSEVRRASMRVPAADAITLPAVGVAELNKLMGRTTEEEMKAMLETPEGVAFLRRLADAQSHVMMGEAFDSCQHQADSDWQRRTDYNGERLGIARPRFTDDSAGGKLTGQAAMVRMQQATGMGALLRFPLWHTGIWITLKAGGDIELLELDRQINTSKTSLGTASYGMVYSNTSVITADHLIHSILQRVYTTTAPDSDPDELLKLIDVRDWSTLIWGALCTQYPDGYPYERACVAGFKKCDHVVSETLQLHKLIWTNQRRLTTGQKKHMSIRTGKRTAEELRLYREGFVNPETTIKINSDITVILRSPTMAEYLEAGHDWIDSIKDSVDASFGGTMSAAERDQEIIKRARTSAAAQYAHYIERIVIRNPKASTPNFVEGVEDVRQMLTVLSGDEQQRDTLLSAIGKYIDDSSISIVAIPRYECPKCKTDQGLVPGRDGELVDPKKHPYLIPLDMLGLFFTITARRITRVLPKVQSTE